MPEPEGSRLAELARAIRESTLKRLRRVPPGDESWRISRRALSIAELARHLVEADRWLFRKLEERSLPPMLDPAAGATPISRAEFIALLSELERTGETRARLLAGLSDAHLRERLPDARFGGEVELWWTIVRGNLDHEAHHRGQLAAYLRALADRRPPVVAAGRES